MVMTEKEIRRKDAEEQLWHNRFIRRMERREMSRKPIGTMASWILEFSKKVVLLCVVLHAAAFLYAAVAMWCFADISTLPVIISESSDILRTCVFGYMIKAGMENWQKIRGGKRQAAQEQQEEGVG